LGRVGGRSPDSAQEHPDPVEAEARLIEVDGPPDEYPGPPAEPDAPCVDLRSVLVEAHGLARRAVTEGTRFPVSSFADTWSSNSPATTGISEKSTRGGTGRLGRSYATNDDPAPGVACRCLVPNALLRSSSRQ